MSNVREILEQIRSELRDHVQNGWKFTLDAEEGAVVLAALDAEGVGLKGEIRRFADEMYDCATVTSQAMHRVCQDLLTRWEERRWSIPLPGQSREPSAGQREALEWYAEQTRDCRKMGRDGDRARQALDADGGARALAALRADEEGGHG